MLFLLIDMWRTFVIRKHNTAFTREQLHGAPMQSSSSSPSVPPPPVPTNYPLTSPRGAGTKLATRTWAPPTIINRGDDKTTTTTTTTTPIAIKAIALIVHGAGWHSGYFAELAELLTNHGIFVAAYDQPSSGYSERDKEAPHNCTHIYNMDEIVDEVYEAVDWARKEAAAAAALHISRTKKQELPLFLIGESFGAVQVLSAAYEFRERHVNLAGVIILGGLIRPAKEALPPPFVIQILTWLSRYYAKFKMPAVDYSATFDDAFGNREWARVARQDPAVNVSPQFTLGAAASILSGGETLLEKATAFPVPLLAIHGRDDCRTQCEAVQEFVDGASKGQSSDATIVLMDTNGHQLLQDKPEITNQVMEKVASWINVRCV